MSTDTNNYKSLSDQVNQIKGTPAPTSPTSPENRTLPFPPKAIITPELRAGVVNYVRGRIDDAMRDALVVLVEEVMTSIIEQEVEAILAPQFEKLYEGVMFNVLQRQLLKAMEQRAAQISRIG
jgi:hypothetical protein